jgi:alkylhydroperoxidase family enzyme
MKGWTMARIPLIDNGDGDETVQAAYGRVEELGFPVLNVFKMMGSDSGFLDGLVTMLQSLYGEESPLDPRYRELAWLRASQLNGCHY